MNVPPQEWYEISEELKNDPNINQNRIAPELLYSFHLKKRTYIIVEESAGKVAIIAIGIVWDTYDEKWLEMGTIFVTPKFRKKGFSSQIFQNLLEIVNGLGKSVFLITKDPVVKARAEGEEWITSKNWDHAPCHGAIGPDRLPVHEKKLFYHEQPVS